MALMAVLVIALMSTGGEGLAPASVARLVATYFEKIPGNYLYFCSIYDAVEAQKMINNVGIAANVRSLLSQPSSDDFKVEVKQPQRMGVFLDLTCDEGYAFLEQDALFLHDEVHIVFVKCDKDNLFPQGVLRAFPSVTTILQLIQRLCISSTIVIRNLSERFQSFKLMNSTYRWLIWTNSLETTMAALKNSRVEADSDVVLAIEGSGTLSQNVSSRDETSRENDLLIEEDVELTFKRLSRIHFLSDHFELIDIPTPEVPPLEGYLPTNFNGFQFNVSIMMAELDFNPSDIIGPLLDRAYMPGADNMRRCGLAVFLHIAELFNFTTSYVVGHVWGDPLENGSWTGMIGHVQRGEAEFGSTLAKYTHGRFRVNDFATSFHLANVCFLFLQPKLFGTYKALVLPLKLDVWLIFAACGIVSVFLLRVSARYDRTSAHNDGWGGSSFLVLSAISNQGIPDNSEHFSTRLIYSVVLLVNFLVGVYYNTSILNGLLLPAPNAIQNSDQLLKSDIHLGLQDITYIKEEMTHNDSLTIRMREKLDKSEKPHYLSTADGVANLRKGQYAFYAEGLAVYHEMERTMSDAQKCSLTEVEKYKPFHIAYVARKNSPYKEHLNRALQRIRERGVLKRMKNYWLHKKPACHWKQDALSLGAEPLFLAYMCMLLGIIASATLFLLEKSFPPRFASKPEVETGTFWP